MTLAVTLPSIIIVTAVDIFDLYTQYCGVSDWCYKITLIFDTSAKTYICAN